MNSPETHDSDDFLVLESFNQDLAKNWLLKHKLLLYHFLNTQEKVDGAI